MEIKWLEDVMMPHGINDYAIPEMLAILPENEHESRLLEAFVAWRHSQNLSKKEQS